jgi:hypothetical protein
MLGAADETVGAALPDRAELRCVEKITVGGATKGPATLNLNRRIAMGEDFGICD